jgi:hypothetical protein
VPARRDRLDRQAPEILPNTIDAGTNGAPPRAEGGVLSCHKKHGEAYCAQRSLRMYSPFDNIAFDIAREIARQLDGGKSGRRVYTAIRHTFPTATRADLKQAGRIVRERWEMLAEADLEAGKGLTKPTAEALFPEPDKTRS